MERQKYETAIRAYSEAIKLDSTIALTYTKRGQAYQALGKESLANKDFSKANDLRSGSYRYPQQSKERALDWEILPPHWWHDPKRRKRIWSTFKDQEQARSFFERLDYLYSFEPHQTYRSRFNNQDSPYYAFVFAECVVAENPLEGNAIYIIKGLDLFLKTPKT